MPRLARGIVVAVLAAFTAVYLLAGSLLAIVAFGLQFVYVFRSLRRFRRPWLLAVQAVVCYTATVGFGTSVGLLGFLGGSLLLTPARPLAPLVAVSAAVIGPADPAISMVLIALLIYGLTRLTERVEEAHAARLALAMAAAAEERLRIAAELSDGIGRGLAAIVGGVRLAMDRPERTAEVLGEVVGTARRSLADTRNAAAGYRATSLAPEVTTARAMLTAAGIKAEVRVGHSEPLGPAGALLAAVLREAVTEALRQNTAKTCVIETTAADGTVRLRVIHDGARTAEDKNLADLVRQVGQAGGSLSTSLSAEGRLTVDAVLPGTHGPVQAIDPGAYRLSLALLAAVLAGFSAKALLLVPASLAVPAAACLVVIVVTQIRSINGRHLPSLVLMALLTYLPIPVFGRAWLGIAGFLAGPVLLAFPWAVAWPLVGCVARSTRITVVCLSVSGSGRGHGVRVIASLAGAALGQQGRNHDRRSALGRGEQGVREGPERGRGPARGIGGHPTREFHRDHGPFVVGQEHVPALRGEEQDQGQAAVRAGLGLRVAGRSVAPGPRRLAGGHRGDLRRLRRGPTVRRARLGIGGAHPVHVALGT
ncbi:hypothetical protein Acor_79640 [Acrocarpospora corrugata]|uniref:Signal transduction histidine kinase subgroup 3 dimerisation and phosphoacceptor domain-containing protein n=1 Tax=Acrocarpospora corrugata TaxID=35763 RepID=A0A5M3WA03_9ACTN|nr:hypothetical protein Acor_79640 [Acrocarpospora corrugata]